MASWKKIIVSGSSPNFAAVQVDNLTSGQVVIGGGTAGNLSTTAINGSGNILGSSGATNVSISGSFSGSFNGSLNGTASYAIIAASSVSASYASSASLDLVTGVAGASLYYLSLFTASSGWNANYASTTGLTYTPSTNVLSVTSSVATYALSAGSVTNNLTQGTGISSFTYNGSSAQSVAVAGAGTLSTNAITKWTGTAFANSSLTDNGTTVSGATSIQLSGASSSLTGSFTGSFAGILTGTSSYATYAVSAGSVANNLTQGTGISTFTYNGGSAQSVAVSGAAALSSNAITKWTGNAFSNSSLTDNGTTVSGATSIQLSGANSSLTGSFSGSFSGTLTSATLTIGNGLTGTSYNGASPVTIAVGAGALISVASGVTNVATSSLSANQIPKYSSNTLAGSNITDTGTQVQIGAGASSGLSVAAGGVTVTGNSLFNNGVTISGNLSVNGTTTFINTTNTYIKDQFINLASGSTALTDAGIVAQYNSANSGSAWYLSSVSTGTYGRWAVAYDIMTGDTGTLTPSEYVVTAKIGQGSTPSAAPTWGGATNGTGNMWIMSSGDIYIYS